MLDIKFIRENPEKVKQNCQKRHCLVDINKLLELDKQRRELLAEVEALRAKHNEITNQIESEIIIGDAKRDLIAEGAKLKDAIKNKDEELKKTEKKWTELAWLLPNMLAPDVPLGKDERDNRVIKKVGEPPKFNFPIKDHLELGEALNLIDVERAAKVAGTRFAYLKNQLVLLEFSLINLAFQTLLKKGFIPILPPVMLRPKMAKGMGYLEQADVNEAYYLPQDDLYLVGTSEQSIGAMHAHEVFQENDLPKRYLGFSTCFRREAGSYGKDQRGIVRVHQFDKLEMFVFCQPENSPKEHQLLLQIEQDLMQALKLPFQVVHLCSGDMGRPSASTFDIETWIPSQNRYRETHSCSNCTDFQARRLNIRYKNRNTGKLDFVHMLNGTVFAIPRLLIAILENNQQKDGSVKIPAVLSRSITSFTTGPRLENSFRKNKSSIFPR